MNNIFVSIIVPVYNVEQYLRESVESIICQINEDWELILVDDGSPDGCPQICDEYAEKDGRVKVIHQQNQGVAVARNAGLDVAQGEWIWFVDSDDVINAANLDSLIKQGLWDIIKDKDYVMFDLKTFNDGEKLNVRTEEKDINTIIETYKSKNEFLLKHVCCHHPRLFYKKSWMMTDPHQRTPLRFTPGLKVCEDGEFQYKYLILCKNPIKINAVTYYYRQREGSAIRNANASRQIVTDTLIVLSNLRAFMAENNICLEPWLEKRFVGTIKAIMAAASRCETLDKPIFQTELRKVLDDFTDSGFDLKKNLPVRIGYKSVRLYLFLLKLYLRVKRLK